MNFAENFKTHPQSFSTFQRTYLVTVLIRAYHFTRVRMVNPKVVISVAARRKDFCAIFVGAPKLLRFLGTLSLVTIVALTLKHFFTVQTLYSTMLLDDVFLKFPAFKKLFATQVWTTFRQETSDHDKNYKVVKKYAGL